MNPNGKTAKIPHPIWSYGLVFSQFALIALLTLLSFPWSLDFWILAIQGGAILLGLWALKTMHLGHFNIIPDPMPEINLVTTGPYRFIRHPMYASILYFFAPVAISENRPTIWLLFLLLTLTLILKLSYEEALLKRKLQDYALYQDKTRRLLPYLF